MGPEALLRAMFARAVEVADPMQVVPAALPHRPLGRVLVVGAGKASARMAEAVESAWGPCDGLVITRDGYARPCRGIEIVEASHPVPDARGVAATERMLGLVDRAGPEDFVLVLISGGASSLLVAPVEGVSLQEKQAVTRALLASGAPIGQMNAVRKHLSAVKGGQLAAAAYPARLLALAISDVPGDAPGDIGSGPTVPGDGTSDGAAAILQRWGVAPPASVARALARPSGVVRPGDPRLARAETRIIAAPARSLEAAAQLARQAGLTVEVLGDALEGEAREVARDHAARVRGHLDRGSRGHVILSGGELTVTRRGDGLGGPNAEYALALALALDGAAGVHALACDTDGVDGADEVAGAVIGPDTLSRAADLGRDAAQALARNDSHGFFAALGDQVVTGPTLTNVNDFRAILLSRGD
ncbi:MAG: glycerate kinase type-2 family protein [Alkalilacustris sp.]